MARPKVNRSVIARRVQHVAPRVSTEPVSRNLAARVPDGTPDVTGQGPRSRKPRKVWAHRDINGRVSQWHGNPFYYSPIEVDARWSA